MLNHSFTFFDQANEMRFRRKDRFCFESGEFNPILSSPFNGAFIGFAVSFFYSKYKVSIKFG